ncbi:hypothetical protein [Barnesiella sp. An55]|uniref:hypothetical protein n=1 Tax=Barnesiella sp. An55 TaxID=1965646 RepID=UPI0011786492|nr:hypothetical protein [Barnesiella sp. An55]HIZ26426.1 hypothetical protein [Candidatus Barnesiella merdipullorum]
MAMGLNSLIDTIKRSIITGTSANVKIVDKSFFAELLGEDNNPDIKGNESLGIKPFWKYDTTKRFPFFTALLRLLYACFMCIVALFYWIASVVCWMFTGEWKSKRTSARLNAIIFISMIIVYIVLIVSMLAFLINNVLLFPPNSDINSRGAITMNQPCGREHTVYLFNTAICWANTGVELLEGDIVEITTSGSFYGRITDLNDKNRDNARLNFNWNNTAYPAKTETFDSLCIYKEADAQFGSLLCHIHSESAGNAYDSDSCKAIIQLASGQKNSFTAHQPGYLYVTVNDIYLTDAVLKKIMASNTLKRELLPYGKENFLQTAWQNPTLWFNDNLGEILLNISITRNVIKSDGSTVSPGIYSRLYRLVEQEANNDHKWIHLAIALVALTLLLSADYAIGRMIQRKRKHTSSTPS